MKAPFAVSLPLRSFAGLAVFLLLAAFPGAGAEELTSEEASAVMAAYQGEDFDEVIALTEAIGEGSPWVRIRANSLQRRGELRFFEADIGGAIADFDEFLRWFPERDPQHWQRGLAYYYAEEYEKGKAQFERHQTVNTQDVENAVWHFLCTVRMPGGSVEKAREEFIPIQRDRRVPMMEVHALFAGDGSVEEVLEAAKPQDAETLSEAERNHLCYAHLYLALYFEALGDEEAMARHIRLAAYRYPMDHYMGRTARVHATVRGVGPGGQGD